MGSFSWNKADSLTQIENVACGEPFKFLIPKEFGGGFIKDHYRDYGYLGKPDESELAEDGKYDMYELLALWNAPDKCQYNGEFNPMKPIDEYTAQNRLIGIQIGCYDNQIEELEYPLKLVSCSYMGTYEDCDGRSYGDPDQGFFPRLRPQYR